LYVIKPEENHNTALEPLPLEINPQCGIICKDDTMLVLGGLNGEILFFSLIPKQEHPALIHTLKLDSENLTCLQNLNQKYLICG
jgi:hypothetical protein